MLIRCYYLSGRFPVTPNIIGTCKGNHGCTACAVKNNLGSSLEGLLYALGNFKISVSYMTLCFLIKVSYGQYTRKPFAFHWVLLSVLSVLIYFFLLSSVSPTWSSFAFVWTQYVISYPCLRLNIDTFNASSTYRDFSFNELTCASRTQDRRFYSNWCHRLNCDNDIVLDSFSGNLLVDLVTVLFRQKFPKFQL